MTRPADHPEVKPPRIGVLLINLGTPDSPEPGAVRRYLGEFLSDPRVVEIPWFVWKPILHGIILRTRPKKSAHAYRQVWTEDGSPLAAITRRQAEALQDRLGQAAEAVQRPARQVRHHPRRQPQCDDGGRPVQAGVEGRGQDAAADADALGVERRREAAVQPRRQAPQALAHQPVVIAAAVGRP